MALTPRSLQVIELLRQALEVADAVPIAVVKRADVYLIDNGVFIPKRVVPFWQKRPPGPFLF